MILLISASQIARIKALNYHTQQKPSLLRTILINAKIYPMPPELVL
jgi:hypothetical protein